MKLRSLLIALTAGLTVAGSALAQVAAKDPWVRATVTQQKATGLFVQLTSPADARLVAAASPVAGVVEIHEMVMDGNVMRMRAVPGLDLPAGKTVKLEPGGYHVMLMDLKQPIKDGDLVDVSLTVEGKDGKRETLSLKAPARPLTARAGDMSKHKH